MMLSLIYNLLSMGLFLGIIIVILFILYKSMKGTTTFQKLNRLTVLAMIITFFGLVFLGYGFLNAVLGSILVLLLIRISYVIYVDSN
ncbi:hypothetical protein [Proteiniclasticum sp.]|uniref:hypothetical protein n=1 Tax=Proteiniclasticum sp. TaxID=2053595 RepID=UPI0025D4773C|nr:hypothetical protein [Proteiniclasticum sp.]